MKTETKTDKATARPWKWSIESINEDWAIITDGNGNIIANVNSETGADLSPLVSTKMPMRDNAALIVKAVNEHAALEAVAEAAKDVQEQFESSMVSVGPDLADSFRVFLKPALANLAAIREQKAGAK